MMRSALLVGALVSFAALGADSSCAFDFTTPEEPKNGTPQVTGAQPARPSEWPATLIFTSGTRGCTATVVGSRVILTAAHCVGNGASGTVSFASATLQAVCVHHPGYGAVNRTQDFALCKTDTVVEGIVFEKINSSIARPALGDDITLLGYGCTREGGFDRLFGVLHVGLARTTRLPAGDDLDTITSGGAALCFGDSGGAAYVYEDSGQTERSILGVNSRGDVNTTSYISSTATRAFVDWALQWSRANGVSICGLSSNATGCHF